MTAVWILVMDYSSSYIVVKYRSTTVNGPYTFFPQYLDIRSTLSNSDQALNINQSSITSSSADAYAVIIEMNSNLPNTASGIGAILGISDGNIFTGSMIVHGINYANNPPCQQFEGLSSIGQLSDTNDTSTGLLMTLTTHFPGEIILQFRPNESWDFAKLDMVLDQPIVSTKYCNLTSGTIYVVVYAIK